MNIEKLFVSCCIFSSLPAAALGKKPVNIIYIYADDMSKGMLSCKNTCS